MDELLLRLDAFCRTRSCTKCPLDQTGLCIAVYSIHEDVSAMAREELEKVLRSVTSVNRPAERN